MTLGTKEVTVPAGGTSSVEVLLDPTIAGPGSYSAVVTATPDDGGGTVRTALAYLLEPEMYDVTVTIKPRAGSQRVSHQLGLSGYGEPWIYEQRSFGAEPGTQSATFRLPPGTYGTGAISFGLAADGAQEGVVSYDPSFTVSKNTEIVLDENKTGRFDYRSASRSWTTARSSDVDWSGEAGYTGFTFFGSVDRLYARPSAGLPGGAPVAPRWCGHRRLELAAQRARGPADAAEGQAGRPAAAHAARRPARHHAGSEARRQLPGRRRRQCGGAAHQSRSRALSPSSPARVTT